FHGFTNVALRQYARYINFDPNFNIFDRGDCEDLIQTIRKSMGLHSKEKRFPKKGTVNSIISKSINTSKSIEKIILNDYPQFMDFTEDIQKIAIEYDNKHFEGMPLSKIKFNGKLKSQQAKAVAALLEKDNGVFVASTGFGKTVTGLALIAKRKINTLILVHNRQLAEQWLERIKVFLTNVEVGSLLGGKEKLSYQVDVATYQSLVSRNGLDIKPAIERYGQNCRSSHL
ncbi:MAG: DEAD/DEAH box helicase family protein, partial [Thalassotalea sp.]|nr:DEAD/DEAH box helicase family protein [Thalassotalea sp.]